MPSGQGAASLSILVLHRLLYSQGPEPQPILVTPTWPSLTLNCVPNPKWRLTTPSPRTEQDWNSEPRGATRQGSPTVRVPAAFSQRQDAPRCAELFQ